MFCLHCFLYFFLGFSFIPKSLILIPLFKTRISDEIISFTYSISIFHNKHRLFLIQILFFRVNLSLKFNRIFKYIWQFLNFLLKIYFKLILFNNFKIKIFFFGKFLWKHCQMLILSFTRKFPVNTKILFPLLLC